MVSTKPILQLSIFCLIQGIINYVQINTYWSCIVPIDIFINLASNTILLESKKCSLTSQGLVGASVNCRALESHFKFFYIHTSSNISLFLLNNSGRSLINLSNCCIPPCSCTCLALSSTDCGTLLLPDTSSKAAGRFNEAKTLKYKLED